MEFGQVRFFVIIVDLNQNINGAGFKLEATGNDQSGHNVRNPAATAFSAVTFIDSPTASAGIAHSPLGPVAGTLVATSAPNVPCGQPDLGLAECPSIGTPSSARQTRESPSLR